RIATSYAGLGPRIGARVSVSPVPYEPDQVEIRPEASYDNPSSQDPAPAPFVDPDLEDQIVRLPRAEDRNIYRYRCPQNVKAEELVCKLYDICITQSTDIVAIFTVAKWSDVVYFECHAPSPAVQLLQQAGLPDSPELHLIPFEDRVSLLRFRYTTSRCHWATERDGNFVFVPEGLPARSEDPTLVLFVPRWRTDFTDHRGLLSIDDARRIWTQDSGYTVHHTPGGFLVRQEGELIRQFMGGLEERYVRPSLLSPVQLPYPDDLLPFLQSYRNRAHFDNIDDNTFDFLDVSYIADVARRIEISKLSIGDRVEVLQGAALAGLKGNVEDILNDEARISFDGLEAASTITTNVLRWVFSPGDLVKVVSGPQNGSSGMVLLVEEGTVVIISDKDNQTQLSVRSFDLAFCKPRSAELHAPLYDVPENHRPHSTPHASVPILDINITGLLPLAIGSKVRIQKGVHSGHEGFVTDVSGDYYQIRTHQGAIDIHRTELTLDDKFHYKGMRKSWLIGRTVEVVGKHPNKGLLGTIKDVHLDHKNRKNEDEPSALVAIDITYIPTGQATTMVPLANLALKVGSFGRSSTSSLVPLNMSSDGTLNYPGPYQYSAPVPGNLPPLTPRASTPLPEASSSLPSSSNTPWQPDASDVGPAPDNLHGAFMDWDALGSSSVWSNTAATLPPPKIAIPVFKRTSPITKGTLTKLDWEGSKCIQR
ncbi:hypothetical protein K474DRAFT_1714249, partial [Panus rudis PR-1116 ss-1]